MREGDYLEPVFFFASPKGILLEGEDHPMVG
jgi:hypothetical protein